LASTSAADIQFGIPMQVDVELSGDFERLQIVRARFEAAALGWLRPRRRGR
jgi:hypothetical protein